MKIEKEIWVFCEINNNEISCQSKNLLAKGLSLSKHSKFCVGAIIIGSDTLSSSEFKKLGVSKLYHYKCSKEKEQNGLIVMRILKKLIEEYNPEILLFSTSYIGKEVSALLASELKLGLTADCIDLYIDPKTERLIQKRLVSEESKIVEITTPDTMPQMATVLYNDRYEHEIELCSECEDDFPIKKFEFIDNTELQNVNSLIIETKIEREIVKRLDLCDIILIGGFGLGNKENFDLLLQVGKLMNAGVGATRTAIDMGWIERTALVGMSGAIVNPQVCITFGVSGASQHIVGIQGAKTIISINKDHNAPINLISDYIVVGDAQNILKELYNRIR